MLQIIQIGNLQLPRLMDSLNVDLPRESVNPDVVITTGDIFDCITQDEMTAVADVFARGVDLYADIASAYDCPIIAVPTADTPQGFIEYVSDEVYSVRPLDDSSFTTTGVGVLSPHEYRFIGWGPNHFGGESLLDLVSPERWIERGKSNSQASDPPGACLSALETAVSKYIMGKATAKQAAAELHVPKAQRGKFINRVTKLKETYQQLKHYVFRGSETPILCSPVDPFTIPADGILQDADARVGSLAIKLTMLTTSLELVLGGQKPQGNVGLIERGRTHTYVITQPSSGMAAIELTPGTSPSVSYPRRP